MGCDVYRGVNGGMSKMGQGTRPWMSKRRQETATTWPGTEPASRSWALSQDENEASTSHVDSGVRTRSDDKDKEMV